MNNAIYVNSEGPVSPQIIDEEEVIMIEVNNAPGPKGDKGDPGPSEWGVIAGDINDQTDLADALNAKANTADLGSLAVKDKVDWDTDIDDIPQTFPPSAHTHGVNDVVHTTYYVKGTQTASTGSWTGELPEIDALYEGLAIDYYLPYAGSGDATLNLTLKGGVQTGAIPCYIGGSSRLTTHISANNICRLIYQTVIISGTSYTGWYLLKAIDNNDNAFQLRFYNNYIKASSAIYRYQLLFHTDPDTVTPLTNINNDTGTNKSMLTNVDFDAFASIYFYYSTTTRNQGAIFNFTEGYYQHYQCDVRFSLNCGTTLTTNKLLYLKVVPQSNGMVRLASDPCWTQTLPNTADGYWYILLGRAYSNYQITLFADHPVYYHDGTALREAYSWDAPRDDGYYVRRNGGWTALPLLDEEGF